MFPPAKEEGFPQHREKWQGEQPFNTSSCGLEPQHVVCSSIDL